MLSGDFAAHKMCSRFDFQNVINVDNGPEQSDTARPAGKSEAKIKFIKIMVVVGLVFVAKSITEWCMFQGHSDENTIIRSRWM